MQRNYTGKLEKITKVIHYRDTGEVRTHMVLVNGNMQIHIVLNRKVPPAIIGHRLRYTRTYENRFLVREQLKDLDTGIFY